MTVKEERELNAAALKYVERIGVYEYDRVGTDIVYDSFYGYEGFIHVVKNILDGKETRTPLTDRKRIRELKNSNHYNYFCG